MCSVAVDRGKTQRQVQVQNGKHRGRFTVSDRDQSAGTLPDGHIDRRSRGRAQTVGSRSSRIWFDF